MIRTNYSRRDFIRAMPYCALRLGPFFLLLWIGTSIGLQNIDQSISIMDFIEKDGMLSRYLEGMSQDDVLQVWHVFMWSGLGAGMLPLLTIIIINRQIPYERIAKKLGIYPMMRLTLYRNGREWRPWATR